MSAPAPATYRESALTLTCEGEQLLAVLAGPDAPARKTGVLIVVGGPQYRAGSHRQFVLLSRHLAAAGHAVLRFDCRGMGDSQGAQRNFEALSQDIRVAIDALQQQVPQVQEVVLWGLCDGASAALLYCDERRDPRVRGLCLLNPWVRSEASLARTHIKHYYRQRLKQKEFWLKLLSGKVAAQALGGLLRSLKLSVSGAQVRRSAQAVYQDRMARAWRAFDGDILLLLSGNDYTAKEFIEYSGSDTAWAGALEQPRVIVLHMPGLDHTCSGAAARGLVERHTLDWLSARSSEST